MISINLSMNLSAPPSPEGILNVSQLKGHADGGRIKRIAAREKNERA